MPYQFNFGSLTDADTPPPKRGHKFRIAVLGDFSARANRGKLETGDAVASRKPLKAAVDTLDNLLERLTPTLRLDVPGSGAVELEFHEMQDFHPDALYEKLEIFSRLAGLRGRLKSSSTFAKAAKELRDIGLAPAPVGVAAEAPRARGEAISVETNTADFARFLSQPTASADPAAEAKNSLNAFLRQIIAPHVSPTKDPQQDMLVAALDEAVSAMMRQVLHHPDFQMLESLWRSLAFMATRLETDETLQIVLIDLSAEEFAADLGAGEQLEKTALYRLLVEDPAEDPTAGAFSVIVGNYVFERTPAHADLLGRMAQIATAAHAPFIASVPAQALDIKPDDIPVETLEAWKALRVLPESAYLALALPRFMLRLPYGRGTEPIDAFKFEEFTDKIGPSSLLWANPAMAIGLLLGETFRQQGDRMNAGSIAGIGEMPYYTYEDADGDQTALPCTERFIAASTQNSLTNEGFFPLLAVKNSPEIRVGIFKPVGGDVLRGWWADPLAAKSTPEQRAATPDGEAEATADAPAKTGSTDAEAAPAAEDSSADLDGLLSSLDAPAADASAAEAESPAAAPATDDDTSLEDLMASLDTPVAEAATPDAPAAVITPAADEDTSLEDLMASLDTPTADAAPPDALAAVTTPAADEDTSLDDLMASLDTPVADAPAAATPAVEADPADAAPAADDTSLDDLMALLDAPAADEAIAEAPADEEKSALEPTPEAKPKPTPSALPAAKSASVAEMDALLAGLDLPPPAGKGPTSPPKASATAADADDDPLAKLLEELG